jgi:hypothetical protein
MSDIVLTKSEIEDIFQALTMRILNIPSTLNGRPINQDKVRISWPSAGAPAFKITDDVTFIQITPVNDPIVQQHDVEYSSKDSSTAYRKAAYTRVHQVRWTLYGPNSFDNADLLRHGLFLFDYFEYLAAQNIYLITYVQSPVRAPELFNGQWWERTDLYANFNEGVQRVSEVPYITSTNVQIKESR